VTGKTAFVTGAATGIGKDLVEKLDRKGWRVWAGYNRTPPGALIDACGPAMSPLPCIISDDESGGRPFRTIS